MRESVFQKLRRIERIPAREDDASANAILTESGESITTETGEELEVE